MSRFFGAFAVISCLCLNMPATVAAQQNQPTAPAPANRENYDSWLRKQVQEASDAASKSAADAAMREAVAQNGNGVSNQIESPSVDQASTSLVDTSSASDFVSMALSLSGISAQSEDNSTPMSGSVTATLYSLIAAAKGFSITDPDFYKAGTKWRRVSFTIGTEESKADEDFTDKPSTNVGVKCLVINDRDIYSKPAQEKLDKIVAEVNKFQDVNLEDNKKIRCLVFRATEPDGGDCSPDNPKFVDFVGNSLGFDAWPKTLEKLEKNTAARAEIGNVIEGLAAERQLTTDAITKKVEEIRQARQFSVAAYTKQRDGQGTDSYRAELIYDHGMSPRVNWTVNAGFDYFDRKTSEDSRDARIATELQAKLSNPGGGIWKARPVTLSASGEAMRGTESTWLVQAQVKLLVPITTGVDLPIAYTYANRSMNGISAGSRLKISLAVDPVRFREWLTAPAN